MPELLPGRQDLTKAQVSGARGSKWEEDSTSLAASGYGVSKLLPEARRIENYVGCHVKHHSIKTLRSGQSRPVAMELPWRWWDKPSRHKREIVLSRDILWKGVGNRGRELHERSCQHLFSICCNK